MDDDTGEDHLIERLRSLGEHPIDGAVAERVLSRARPRHAWLRSTKLKVAAAFAGGFLVGGVGLASAGTLPAPAQDVAHDALSAVGINVPPGHDRYNGPECGGTYKNHGQYVRAHKDDPNAGQSPCGKPVKSLDKTKTTTTDDTADSDTSGDAGRHGPPPWVGKGKEKPDKAEDESDDGGAARTVESTTSTLATTATTTEAPTTTTMSTTTTEVTTTTTTTSP